MLNRKKMQQISFAQKWANYLNRNFKFVGSETDNFHPIGMVF